MSSVSAMLILDLDWRTDEFYRLPNDTRARNPSVEHAITTVACRTKSSELHNAENSSVKATADFFHSK